VAAAGGVAFVGSRVRRAVVRSSVRSQSAGQSAGQSALKSALPMASRRWTALALPRFRQSARESAQHPDAMLKDVHFSRSKTTGREGVFTSGRSAKQPQYRASPVLALCRPG
jgi:hypothetical protein